MFGRIFNPENAFFRTADKLADLVMLSLMWALCSIPLVTLGPATAALYDAAVKISVSYTHLTLPTKLEV